MRIPFPPYSPQPFWCSYGAWPYRDSAVIYICRVLTWWDMLGPSASVLGHLLCARCFLRCRESNNTLPDSEASFLRFTLFFQQNLTMNNSIPVPLTDEQFKNGLFNQKMAWEFSALNLEFEMSYVLIGRHLHHHTTP